MKKSTIPGLVVILAALFSSPATASQLLNISTRLDTIGTDENVLIGGFIVTGSEPKKVILRAIGPSLSDFDIIFGLIDPVLELHNPDGTVVINDNWRDTQEQEIIDTGIPPTDDLESAIVATLSPGAYTAIVYDAVVESLTRHGTGLVEAYDLDQAADSRLGNISSRGYVLPAASLTMIAGVIIGGDAGDATVVIRGIGPSLADFGVVGALPDPALGLHNENGDVLAINDNWQDDPAAAQIEAAGLAPTDPLEAAVLTTLPPGLYTAILAGSATLEDGVGLVEVYHLQ